ncbi:MAG: hypothetical protein ACRBFS_22960 [Aureispira sp.]
MYTNLIEEHLQTIENLRSLYNKYSYCYYPANGDIYSKRKYSSVMTPEKRIRLRVEIKRLHDLVEELQW